MRIAPYWLSVSRRSISRILSLPCYVGMTSDEIAHVGDRDPGIRSMTVYSLVIPVYKSAAGLPALFVELARLDKALDNSLEVIFVIDGSPDDSGATIINTPHAFKSRTVFHNTRTSA